MIYREEQGALQFRAAAQLLHYNDNDDGVFGSFRNRTYYGMLESTTIVRGYIRYRYMGYVSTEDINEGYCRYI